jgi:hypothetical protein
MQWSFGLRGRDTTSHGWEIKACPVCPEDILGLGFQAMQE